MAGVTFPYITDFMTLLSFLMQGLSFTFPPYKFTLPCQVGPWNHIGCAGNRGTGKKRLINTCFSKEQAGPPSRELLSGKLSSLGHQETRSHVVKGGAKGSSRRLSKMVLWDTRLRAPSIRVQD